MLNQSYLSLWFSDFTVERGTHHLEALLTLFPASATRPDLRLIIRGLDTTQSVTLERELDRDPAAIRSLASEFLHEDTGYEVTARWDLWQWEQQEGLKLEWTEQPSPVEFLLQGLEFDDKSYTDTGHVWIRLGAEHLFTGHAGMLTGDEIRPEDFTDRKENEFAWALQEPQNLHDYRRFTRENVRTLYGYLREIEKSLPVERLRLWSEGEQDFEELTEKILAGNP
jgi:hypothetical protein